jgi:glycerol-3-phosphate O-acyltransferase
VLARRYERLYVQFEEPISLRRAAEERLGAAAGALAVDEAWGGEEAPPIAASLPSLLSPRRGESQGEGGGGALAPSNAKRQLVQALANRIAYGISRAVTITPVGLVAAALLSHVRRGLPAAEVARRVELLRYIAAEGGARFARGLGGAPSDPRVPGPVADAIRRLEAGGVIRSAVAAGETIYQVPEEKRPVLDYHRNAVIHRFVAPALVAAAVRAEGTDAPAERVRARALALSRLLKLEFMYRVGATFDEIFEQNVAFLVRVGALAREGDRVRPGAEAATLTFLSELMRPYLEAYRLAAATALELLSGGRTDAPLDRRALVKQALEQGRAAFLAGAVALRESLSKATLENAVEWMIAQGLLAEQDGRLTLRDRDALRDLVDRMSPLLSS